MIGVALAGGKGTRLRPFTSLFNKHFFPIGDKPIIYYCLYQFKLLKIDNICIVCNQNDKKFFVKIINHYFSFKKVDFVFQNNPLGINHGIYLVKNKYKSKDLVINLGDHFLFDMDGNKEIYNSIYKNENLIFSIKNKDVKPYGNLLFSKKNNSLVKIIEKPKKKHSKFILCGLIKLSSSLTVKIKLNKKSARGEYEWVDFINENLNYFNLVKLSNKYNWIDLGTFERIGSAQKVLSKYEFS